MSDDKNTSRSVGIAVLKQQVTSLEARLKVVETRDYTSAERNATQYTEILQRISKLESRVGFMAAGIGMVSGLAASLIPKLIF